MGTAQITIVEKDARFAKQLDDALRALGYVPGFTEKQGADQDNEDAVAATWVRAKATAIGDIPNPQKAPVQTSAIRFENTPADANFMQRTSDERFRALIEKAADLILVIDSAGLIQFASPAVESVMGYEPQSVLGHSFLEWIHPDDLPQATISLESRSQMPGTAPSSLTLRCRHKNGEWRSLEALGTNLLADPAVAGIVLNIRDATPRLAAEAELARRMRELSALNELGRRINTSLSVDEVLNVAVDEIIKAVQPDAAILFNPHPDGVGLQLRGILPASAQEKFGNVPDYRAGECLCGMAIQQGIKLYSPDIFNDVRCTGLECKKAGMVSFAALPVSDGSRVTAVLGLSSETPRDFQQQDAFLEALLHQVAGALQNARLYEAAQREIDERRQLEAELRQSEARYRNLFEDSPISLWEEDFSQVNSRLKILANELNAANPAAKVDYQTYLAAHPEIAAQCAELVQVTAVNRATLELFHVQDRNLLIGNLSRLMDQESLKLFSLELVNILNGKTVFGWEGTNSTFDGQKIEINLRWAAAPGYEESLSRVIISMLDITERKRSEEQLKKREQEINLLYNASLAFSQSLDPAHHYNILHREISAQMDCDGLFISAFDQETQRIRCIGAFHEHQLLDVSGFPVLPLEPVGHGTQSRVIRSKQAWLINDYEHEAQSSSARHYIGDDGQVFEPEQLPADVDVTRSAIIFPLMLQDQVRGVIQILSYRKNAYTQENMALALALAAQFSIANNNALLYRAAQDELSERKRAENALRESEERYRLLLENTPVGISVIAEGKIIFCNTGTARLLGAASPEQIVGRPIEKIIHPSNWPVTRERMRLLITGEKVQYPVEDLYMRLDGSSVPVEVISAPIKFQEQPAHLVITTDISQRKAAAQALIEAHAQLEERVRERTIEVQDLYDNAPCAYHSLDAEARFVHINQTELRWMGYERNEVIGHPITEFLSHTSKALFLTLFPGFKRSGNLTDLELEFICKDGKPLSLLVNATASFDENGVFKMSRSTLIDISPRKHAEQALRESEARLRQNRDELRVANIELEKAARLKDEFLASMSHELRTPLTGILGLSEAMQLKTYGELSEKQLYTLKNIEKSGRHLLELINDILDLSKIEAGKLDVQFEPCALSDVCQASLQLTRGMAQQKKQTVEFSMDPQSRGAVITADKRRLKQMFVNLLSNAVKFTPEGGELGLTVTMGDGVVNIAIWDQGIGIDEADLSRLFEPFVQLDSSLSRQYAGTGLGLSLVKRMAELHRGSVTVQSKLGQGSRFTISLPLASSSAVSGAVAGQWPRQALICDHNPIDAEQTERYLQGLRIASTQQTDAARIALQAGTEHPDFILMELDLPGKSGLELLAELRSGERTRFIPTIIVSMQDIRRKAVSFGAAGYLVKPFTQADLQTELEKIFRAGMTGEAGKNFQTYSSESANHSSMDHSRLPGPADGKSVTASNEKATLGKEFVDHNPAVGRIKTILIADDNEENLQMLADFLESRHFVVDQAQNGLEMLAHAEKNHPALILVDVQMPEMDGLEAMRRIRANPDPRIAATPMIAITALAMPGDRERCLSAGANQYLSKPLQLGLLIEFINASLKD